MQQSTLNLGKMNISAKDEDAYGLYFYYLNSEAYTPDSMITGSITVKSANAHAYGFLVAAFHAYGDSSKIVKIGANITVNGKSYACGISTYYGDVILDGAKITAKVTAKGQKAYSVYHNGDEGNSTITISGKSQLTGGIHIGNDDDTVSIESGSKVSGGMSGVEKLLFNINDASTKKKVMWNATGDWGESALDYNIDFGLLGDFALISKTKDMQWSDLLISNLESLSKSNDLYKYTVYEKGNTLYLKSEISSAVYNASVVENKSTTTKKISAEYTLFTSKADINVKSGDAAVASSDGDKGKSILVLDNNITISGSRMLLHGVKLKDTQDNFEVYSNNAAKNLKVTNSTKEQFAYAYGYYGENSGSMSVGGSKFMQNITVSLTNKGTNPYGETFAYGIKYLGEITFKANYTGNMTVTAKGLVSTACGICNLDLEKDYGAVSMQDISGTWKISSNGYSLAVRCDSDLTLGNVYSKMTISGDDYAAAFVAEYGNIKIGSINSSITVSSGGRAYGIHTKKLTIGDCSKMNLKVTAKGTEAYGMLTEDHLIIQAGTSSLGKINVTNSGKALGISVRANLYASGDSEDNLLSGTISVKSAKGSANGILADRFYDGSDSDTYVAIGANISVTGATDAYGISFLYGNLYLEGAKITAKVSDKSSFAYAVYEKDEEGDDDSKGNRIELSGKSQLTGSIYAAGDDDTVVIESGSKLTGGLEDVEKLVLELNDPAAKKSLWDITADLSDSTNLEIDFELGMTGDFVLANNKSGADWNGLFEDSILLKFGDNSQYLFLSDVTTYGYDSLTYNDYDFTLKTKGSQLILSVSGN